MDGGIWEEEELSYNTHPHDEKIFVMPMMMSEMVAK